MEDHVEPTIDCSTHFGVLVLREAFVIRETECLAAGIDFLIEHGVCNELAKLLLDPAADTDECPGASA